MTSLLNKLALLLRRRTYTADLTEEMAFHREQMEKDLLSQGQTPEAAHRQAARHFGNPTKLRDQSHETVSFWFETALQDIRFAARQLARNPGFTITATLMLALGLGASVAIFAFVDAALIKPLPYRDPNRLVEVTESIKLFPHANLSYPDYEDWKRLNTVFQSMDVYTGAGYLLNLPAGTVPVPALRVSDGFFRTLGVTPILGRDFYSGEDQPNAPNTAILSYATWQRRYQDRKDVIGQTVILSGVPATIIGVLPKTFHFTPRGAAEFFLTTHDRSACEKRRSCHNLVGVGRLKDGVTVPTAYADMASIASQLERQYPDSNRDQGASVRSLSEAFTGDVRPILLTLLAGAGLLLLIACINVSSLLLVRSESRRREIAVRGALGASRARLTRQFITEGLLLVAMGCAAGLATAYASIKLLTSLISEDMMDGMPYLQGLSLNLHTLAFAAVISLAAAVLFSLAPILRLPVTAMRDDLTEGSRSAASTLWRRFGANLVLIELATAVVLLVGAGLLGKSLYRLLHVDPAFNPSNLALVQVALSDTTYPKDEQQEALARTVIARAQTLPGVTSAAAANMVVFSGDGNTDWIRIVGREYHGEHNEVNARDVSSTYFPTLQAKLIAGRFFTEQDTAGKPPVAIINKSLARQYFPNEDPIGKVVGDTALSPKSLQTIVGVVDDVREGSLETQVWPAIYGPMNQNADDSFFLVVRTAPTMDPATILPTLVATIHQVDPGLGTYGEQTMAMRINESSAAYIHRTTAYLVGGFAALALILGVVGLYGVIAYSVSQRRREIGVRIALGAQRATIYNMVLKEAGRLTLLGIAAGILASLAFTALMRKLLFNTHSWDIPTLTAVATLLTAASLAAAFIPAHRAATVDPAEALRAE
jgi:macrolide transport system ATP-binding/permease protein